MLWKILLVLGLVATNGFFVAAEFALVKLRGREIKALGRRGDKAAKTVTLITQHLDAYLSACQLGITLASLGLGWVGEPFVARMLEPLFTLLGIPLDKVHFVAFPLAFAVITFLHITAGEQVPKMLAIQRAERTSLAVALPLVVFYKLFKPFIWFLNAASNMMLRAVGVHGTSEHGDLPTEEELREMLIDSTAGGALTRRERVLLENVLDLGDKIARRYMVPRNQVVYIDRNDSIDEKLHKAAASDHTRLPLCEGDLDHIIGLVHVKDIFKATTLHGELTTLVDVARKPAYLPETVTLDVLLRGFQENHTLLAILVDEYGVMSGMITLENVIEELVGPILDEFDSEPPLIVKTGPDRFEIDAVCPIDEVVKTCQLALSETQADTIGGLMIDILGHIPEANETLEVGHHKITVLQAQPTRIQRVLLERLKPETEKEPG